MCPYPLRTFNCWNCSSLCLDVLVSEQVKTCSNVSSFIWQSGHNELVWYSKEFCLFVLAKLWIILAMPICWNRVSLRKALWWASQSTLSNRRGWHLVFFKMYCLRDSLCFCFDIVVYHLNVMTEWLCSSCTLKPGGAKGSRCGWRPVGGLLRCCVAKSSVMSFRSCSNLLFFPE